jgi:hypothetical protein
MQTADLIKALSTIHERAFSLLSAEAGPIHRLLVQAGGVAKATETVAAAIGWSAFKRRRHLLALRG